MTTTVQPAPPAAGSPYERWLRHFRDKLDRSCTLPWNDPYTLSAGEHRIAGRSIQQFQLGEWARGRGLRRRASLHPAFAADGWFLPALELFIAEEQDHSAILGRFLDRERIGRLKRHWLDGAFRRLRKLAGLEVCTMTLVTAEALAVPFYRALRDATRSPLLRAICVRILCDESAHLDYQALTLGLIRRPLGAQARRIRSFCHAMLFRGTALLLWQQHRPVFRAAGWDFRDFWAESHRTFALLQHKIRRVCLTDHPDRFSDLRLD